MISYFENSKIVKGNEVAGVSVHFVSNESIRIQVAILKQHKSEVTIVKQYSNLSELKDCFQKISGQIPIYLSVDGKGIVHKKISTEKSHMTEKEKLHQVFPDSKPNEFYMQEHQITTNQLYFSIGRKKQIDNLVRLFKRQNYFVIGLTLGPYDLVNIAAGLDAGREIYTGPYHIELNESAIENFRKADNVGAQDFYMLGDERINGENLIAVAVAFRFFINWKNSSCYMPEIQTNREEFFYKKVFVKAGWGMLIFFFAVLLINFLFYSHYNDKNAVLMQEYNNNQQLLARLDSLTAKYKFHKSFIEMNNLNQASKNAYYSDRMGASVPKRIKLKEMTINPLQEKIENDEKLLFNQQVIFISGETGNSLDLNDWIRSLKRYKWIRKVEIISFKTDRSNKGIFQLKIIIT